MLVQYLVAVDDFVSYERAPAGRKRGKLGDLANVTDVPQQYLLATHGIILVSAEQAVVPPVHPLLRLLPPLFLLPVLLLDDGLLMSSGLLERWEEGERRRKGREEGEEREEGEKGGRRGERGTVLEKFTRLQSDQSYSVER